MSDRYPDQSLDIFALPPPPVLAALDYEATRAAVIADFVARLAARGVTFDVQASELDPAVALIEEACARELNADAAINDAAKAVMWGYSYKGNQDWLYKLLGIARLVVRPAVYNSAGGLVTAAVMEGDEAFRFRAQVAPEGQAPGLTGGGYAHVALRAAPEVVRVSLVRTGAGHVDVVLQGRTVAEGGTYDDGRVSPASVAAVRAALNDDWSDDPSTGSQMTDVVQVMSAVPAPYAVSARAVVPRGPSVDSVRAAGLAALATAAAGLQMTGGEVATDAVIAALRTRAVTKLWLDSPAADVVCTPYQVPHMASAAYEVAADDSEAAARWLRGET